MLTWMKYNYKSIIFVAEWIHVGVVEWVSKVLHNNIFQNNYLSKYYIIEKRENLYSKWPFILT